MLKQIHEHLTKSVAPYTYGILVKDREVWTEVDANIVKHIGTLNDETYAQLALCAINSVCKEPLNIMAISDSVTRVTWLVPHEYLGDLLSKAIMNVCGAIYAEKIRRAFDLLVHGAMEEPANYVEQLRFFLRQMLETVNRAYHSFFNDNCQIIVEDNAFESSNYVFKVVGDKPCFNRVWPMLVHSHVVVNVYENTDNELVVKTKHGW